MEYSPLIEPQDQRPLVAEALERDGCLAQAGKEGVDRVTRTDTHVELGHEELEAREWLSG